MHLQFSNPCILIGEMKLETMTNLSFQISRRYYFRLFILIDLPNDAIYQFRNQRVFLICYLCYKTKDVLNLFIYQQLMKGATKKIDQFIIFLDELLGQGANGKVYKGECERKRQKCAIKMIQKSLINTYYLKKALWDEMQILQKISSQNIVKCIDVQQSKNNYYIIQQICESDLQKYMLQNEQIGEEQAIDILRQIVNAFTVLVREGIIHRDLKPANVLLKGDIIKIADFGTAKENTSQKMKNQTYIGTPLYMSPQMLNGDPYSSKCDVWACGFIFYQLLHNKLPWYGATRRKILQEFQNTPLVIKKGLNSYTVDFLKKTLQLNQDKRLSWDEVFSHNIFHGCFDYLKVNNKLVEDQLKMLMNCLKQQVDRKGIDVYLLIKELELQQELSLQQFRRFIKMISADITGCLIIQIFDQLASHVTGTISINTIQQKMHQYSIQMHRSGLRKHNSQIQTLKETLFKQMYKELKEHNKKLKDAFNFYSKENPSIDFDKFRKMMSRYGLDDKELLQIFKEIDIDNSKSIEYQQIKKTFCQVNFIPLQVFEKQ